MESNAEHSPFFSIVTPNHNSGSDLARCIASLENNVVEFEHIIIDDGSSDDAFDQLEKQALSGHAPQVVLHRNTHNMGPGRTRNHGLALVKGRYVLFCDADDTFVPGALDILKTQIEAYDEPDAVVFRYCLQGPQGDHDSTPLCEAPLEKSQQMAFQDFMKDRIVSSPWGKAIRADLACSLSFPDLPVSQDSLYNLALFGRAERVLYLPDVLYRFDKRSEGSLTRKPFGNRELEKFHRSWQVFDIRYRRDFAATHGLALLEVRALRFVGVSFIMRQAINKTRDDGDVRRVVMKQLRQSSWAALRQLSLKEKALLMSYALSPSLSRQLLRRSHYAS